MIFSKKLILISIALTILTIYLGLNCVCILIYENNHIIKEKIDVFGWGEKIYFILSWFFPFFVILIDYIYIFYTSFYNFFKQTKKNKLKKDNIIEKTILNKKENTYKKINVKIKQLKS